MEDNDDRYYPDDQTPSGEEIDWSALPAALRSLQMFDDPYLSMQATNLGIVDEFITDLESKISAEMFRDDPDRSLLPFLNAQSQMWMFSAYELLRTWRHRVRDAQKLAQEGRLGARIAELKKEEGFVHVGRLGRARQLQAILDDADTLRLIDEDLRLTHIVFHQLDFLRVALAKHEVKGRKNSVAYAPGYARIETWTGSLQYQLEAGQVILGTLTRREVADSIRAIRDRTNIQTREELADFDQFMKSSRVPPTFE